MQSYHSAPPRIGAMAPGDKKGVIAREREKMPPRKKKTTKVKAKK